MLEIGTVVDDRYRVLRELGRGGTGIVYLALDERSNRTWAIKVISGEKEDHDLARRALMSEAYILKSLHHRYLPVIAEILENEDCVIIIMEYIEGRSMKEMLIDSMKRDGHPLLLEDVIMWAGQLCEVLHYLHTAENAVIYGDLKPGNVMVRPDGSIALIDFGTVRLSGKNYEGGMSCLGTPGYAAPEQYGSRRLGPWTDIYSFGATLHCLLTGRDPAQMPFSFPGILECCPQLEEELSVRQKKRLAEFERIIERCTCYSAGARYHSCEEIAVELAAIGRIEAKSMKRLCGKKTLFKMCLCAVILSGILAVGGALIEKRMKSMQYTMFIEQAKTLDFEEKINYFRRAVELDPYRETAYMGLLDMLLEDGLFSDNDEKLMTELLYARGNSRKKDNKTCLQENNNGYAIFSYKMGMACYYMTGESGGRIRASGWLKTVVDMNMDQLDLGIYDSQKEIWQNRADVLVRFTGFYNESLRRTEYAEDTILYGENYWEDLKILLSDFMDEWTDIELRLYQEIVLRVSEGIGDFQAAGIDKRELEYVLEEITYRISVISQDHQDRSEELREQIEQAIEKVKTGMNVVYGESGGQHYDEK
ncbi:MAG: serine/threonine protein kinase [Coprococcus sp.]